jgi:1,4-alpha-glucan branching enzyme
MSIKKQYLKTKPVCKVTFKVGKEFAGGAEKISLLGDFNDWSDSTHEMKMSKDGSFSTTVELESGREYQFRYLADGSNWLTEEEADSFVASGFGDAQNAVINL